MNDASTCCAPCRILPWDSDFFGHRVAAVDGDRLTEDRLRTIDSWCREHAVECLYFLARADDPVTAGLAERNGFDLVETRLTYERIVPDARCAFSAPDLPANMVVRSARQTDIDAVGKMAAAGFSTTRFCTDTHFIGEKVADFYRTWITECIRGKTDFVLVAERNGRPAGYIAGSVHAASRRGILELITVDAEQRRNGIGSALIESACVWYARAGVTRITVTTQGANTAARELCHRFGFVAVSRELYYHKWYPRSPEAQ